MNFQRLAQWLQLDRSLSFALMARVWQAISGPITVALQISAFNLHELGIFVGILINLRSVNRWLGCHGVACGGSPP